MTGLGVVSEERARRARAEMLSHYADHMGHDGPILAMGVGREEGGGWVVTVDTDPAKVLLMGLSSTGVPVRVRAGSLLR